MKHILKTRYFAKWMSKTELNDSALCKAVSEMERGLIDADLGGGVVKKRVAFPVVQERQHTYPAGDQQG